MGTDLQMKQSVKKFQNIIDNPITQKIELEKLPPPLSQNFGQIQNDVPIGVN